MFSEPLVCQRFSQKEFDDVQTCSAIKNPIGDGLRWGGGFSKDWKLQNDFVRRRRVPVNQQMESEVWGEECGLGVRTLCLLRAAVTCYLTL